jgi:DNA-3-methyladenine glycosylase
LYFYHRLPRPVTERSVPGPWNEGRSPDRVLDFRELEAPVVEAARALLGCRLLSSVGDRVTSGVIVETEAYGGPDDPASHAATATGVTDRNRAMYGPAGRLYVYRSYGVHWCANVVTGSEGSGSAVLLRGLELLEGYETALERRGRHPLAAGPGRLCEALGITASLYGHDLTTAPLRLLGGWAIADADVGVSARIGVSVGADRPHRFYVRGSDGVSRRQRPAPRRARSPLASEPGERA